MIALRPPLRRRLVLCASTLAVLLIAAGCSDGENEPAGPDAGSCGPGSCAGCCQGTRCMGGLANLACGANGLPCILCAASETCAAGRCSYNPDCNPGNCPTGCCAGAVCSPGARNEACGRGGAVCLACGNGRACTEGVCVGPGCLGCTGCCTGDNTCAVGNTREACGSGGGACMSCSTSALCQNGACVGQDQPSCQSKCAGAPDGVGGTCTANTCPGCCDSASTCLAGLADGACGYAGQACAVCTSGEQACKGGSCVTTCTPSCEGKCVGEDNGCGKPCVTNSCPGCCDGSGKCRPGTSSSACGTGGVSCKMCGSGSAFCADGECRATCVSSCSGKCSGADDGCGEPCTANSCGGCCDTAKTCRAGTSSHWCGSGGASCQSCPSGEECRNGWCTPVTYRIWLVKGELNRIACDVLGCDPIVYLNVGTGKTFKSPMLPKTEAPVWNYAMGDATQSEILSRFEGDLRDGRLTIMEALVCSFKPPFSAAMLAAGGPYEVPCNLLPATLGKLWFRFEKK